MACDAHDLRKVMNDYSGGSDERYRHTFNRRFIYSAGVRAVAEAAECYWLIDMVALQMAPTYAAAWKRDEVSIGIIKVNVPPDESDDPATVSLSLQDDAPPAIRQELDFTDFPPGEWTFYLGTDDAGDGGYVTTMYLPQEH